MRFNFCRFEMFWNMRPVRFRRLADPEFAAGVKRITQQRLVPLAREVTSNEKLFEVLMRDGEPLPWFATNAAIRAAILVAIGDQIGLPPAQIRSDLRSKAVQISNGLTKHSPFAEAPDIYVAKVQEDWASGLA
jgi:hypothetical protein